MEKNLTLLWYYDNKYYLNESIRKKIFYEIIDFWLRIQQKEDYITIFQTYPWIKDEIKEIINSKDRDNLEEEIWDYLNMLVRYLITCKKSRDEIFLILENKYNHNSFKRLIDNVSSNSWEKNKKKFFWRYIKIFDINIWSEFDRKLISNSNFYLQKSKEDWRLNISPNYDSIYEETLLEISKELWKNIDDFVKFSKILNKNIKDENLLFLRSYSILWWKSINIFKKFLWIENNYDFFDFYFDKNLITNWFPDLYFSLFKKFSNNFSEDKKWYLFYLIDNSLNSFFNLKEVYKSLDIDDFKEFCENLENNNIISNIELFILFLSQKYLNIKKL